MFVGVPSPLFFSLLFPQGVLFLFRPKPTYKPTIAEIASSAVGFAVGTQPTHNQQPTMAPSMTSNWLPPIPGLHRRDPEHQYWLDEQRFPISVTGVIGCMKSEFAMARIAATRATWEPRGNTAHKALELFLQSGALFSVQGSWSRYSDMIGEMDQLATGDWAEWVQPLIHHQRWQEVEVIASERPTCCRVRSVAGTYDCAYLDEQGRTVIADLKSLQGPSSSTYSTAAQLGGYMALEATWGVRYEFGQSIWCRPGETTFGPLLSRDECLTAWAAAWATWRGLNPDHQAHRLLA